MARKDEYTLKDDYRIESRKVRRPMASSFAHSARIGDTVRETHFFIIRESDGREMASADNRRLALRKARTLDLTTSRTRNEKS